MSNHPGGDESLRLARRMNFLLGRYMRMSEETPVMRAEEAYPWEQPCTRASMGLR